MTINYETGELVPLDPTDLQTYAGNMREVAVSTYLEHARTWLSTAVDMTGPEQIAVAKAALATTAEATKQLNLSREIQLDAQEMVRRAEYALGKAIRKGQEEGTVTTRADGPLTRDHGADSTKVSARSLFGGAAAAQAQRQVMSMADDVEPDDFDDALDEAKAEGNLSRANVVRKIKGLASGETRDDRARKVADLAQQGHTSQQIASAVGIGREAVKLIAKDYGIHIPADHAVGKRQRLNSNRILSGVVDSLEVAALSLQQVNPLDLDQDNAQEWVDSLTESLTALRKAANSIKESLRA